MVVGGQTAADHITAISRVHRGYGPKKRKHPASSCVAVVWWKMPHWSQGSEVRRPLRTRKITKKRSVDVLGTAENHTSNRGTEATRHRRVRGRTAPIVLRLSVFLNTAKTSLQSHGRCKLQNVEQPELCKMDVQPPNPQFLCDAVMGTWTKNLSVLFPAPPCWSQRPVKGFRINKTWRLCREKVGHRKVPVKQTTKKKEFKHERVRTVVPCLTSEMIDEQDSADNHEWLHKIA